MKNRKYKLALGILSLGTLMLGGASFAKEHEAKVVGSIAVKGQSLADFPKLARVSTPRAAEIAATQGGGSVISIGLENEDGYLVYAAEVVGGPAGHNEILVDAGTGKVLADMKKSGSSTKHESEDDDEENE